MLQLLPASIGAAKGSSGLLGSLGGVGGFLSGVGDFVGSLFGADEGPSPEEQINHQVNLTRRVMMKQLPWMVHGAKEAGLHPLTAVGVNPASGGGLSFFGGGGPDVAGAISAAGQGISRAAQANQPRQMTAFERISTALSLENQELQNERLRSEIRLMSQPGTPPGLDINSIGDPDIKILPKEIVANEGPREKGIRAALQWFNLEGVPVRARSQDFAEATEDDFIMPAFVSGGYTVPDYIRGRISRSYDDFADNQRDRVNYLLELFGF